MSSADTHSHDCYAATQRAGLESRLDELVQSGERYLLDNSDPDELRELIAIAVERLQRAPEETTEISAPAQPEAGSDEECSFCDYEGPAQVLADYVSSYVIEPIDPVTPGHVLIIPKPLGSPHPDAFAANHYADRDAIRGAELWLADPRNPHRAQDFNLITSRGEAATQTVRHLHVHLVPRREGDELALPWARR